MAYKGKFKPKNLQKYVGDKNKNIIWRSLWERRFMERCDSSPSILHWSSEEVIVRYISPIDNKVHRYFIDFWIEVKEKDGSIKQKLIEIKPYDQSIEPHKKKRRLKRFYSDVKRYGINQAKWYYARQYAAKNNMEFLVITEKGVWEEENKFVPSKHKLF